MRARHHLAQLFTIALGKVMMAVGMSPSAWAEPEANDTLAAATPIAVGVVGITDASIGASGDIDFYRFEAPTAGTYTIDVSDAASSLTRMCVRPYGLHHRHEQPHRRHLWLRQDVLNLLLLDHARPEGPA